MRDVTPADMLELREMTEMAAAHEREHLVPGALLIELYDQAMVTLIRAEQLVSAIREGRGIAAIRSEEAAYENSFEGLLKPCSDLLAELLRRCPFIDDYI